MKNGRQPKSRLGTAQLDCKLQFEIIRRVGGVAYITGDIRRCPSLADVASIFVIHLFISCPEHIIRIIKTNTRMWKHKHCCTLIKTLSQTGA